MDFLKGCLIGLVLSVVFFAATAQARGIQAQSGAECSAMADVAVTARALVQHGVGEETRAAVLASIYVPVSDRAIQILVEIDRAARTAALPADAWAKAFLEHCIATQGDVESFFGTRV